MKSPLKPEMSVVKTNSGALKRTFWFSCLALLLLQIWRPYYFLADDNLLYWLPIVNALGVRLAHFQSPFFDPNLFGGYNFLRDPTALLLWNPLVLGLSFLANTPFYLAMADLFASINLIFSALAFALLICRLRDLKSLQISDGRIAFLSLSFTFSTYALNIGACWLIFLANQVSLPLIVLGLFATRQKNGILCVAGGLVYALLVGHLSPFLYTLLFLSFFVGGLCWHNRSWQPLIRWGAGLALAVLLTSPFLIPAAQGFLSSPRNASVQDATTSKVAVPFAALVAAYFGGYLGIAAGSFLGLFGRFGILGLSCCLANYQFFGSLPKRRSFSRLELSIAALMLLVALFMAQPSWLAVVIGHVPLYRSLRWPFRETFIFIFLAHLWIALRPVIMAPRTFALSNAIGITVFCVSLALVPPWILAPMTIDRHLLISGQAHSYWARVKPLVGAGNSFIVVAAPQVVVNHDREIPHSLLGSGNFPALFEVPSLSGYTAPGFDNPGMAEDVPYFFGGIYSPEVAQRLMAKNAHLKIIRLTSLRPLRIDLCSREGCQILPTPPVSAAAQGT